MQNVVKAQTFDQERSLYNMKDGKVIDCHFSGVADGESPLKEARNISVVNSDFSLRYPLWHVEKFKLLDSRFDELSRAPIWYAIDGEISNTTINSIKCIRNCENIEISRSTINSEEAIWMSDNIKIKDSSLTGDYLFLRTNNVNLKNCTLNGKYGLQYMRNVEIKDSRLNTKDAFWHSEDVVIKDSIVDGAYLGWYSKNLTLINCKITGTQPFCYCENLKIINCTMDNCDLAFEYSSVEADIIGKIISVKNPKSGYINAGSIEEVILTDSIMASEALISVMNNN